MHLNLEEQLRDSCWIYKVGLEMKRRRDSESDSFKPRQATLLEGTRMQVFSTIFRFDFISSPSDFTFKLVSFNLYYALSCSMLFSLNSNLNLLQVRSVVIVLFFRFPPSSLLLFLCLFRFLSFCIVFFYFTFLSL